jgi:hypothetical protein
MPIDKISAGKSVDHQMRIKSAFEVLITFANSVGQASYLAALAEKAARHEIASLSQCYWAPLGEPKSEQAKVLDRVFSDLAKSKS